VTRPITGHIVHERAASEIKAPPQVLQRYLGS
jgi:hypothetical protein